MYSEAFTYPFEGEESTERLLIGSGIVLVYGVIYLLATVLSVIFIGFLLYPLLLVPLLVLYGYSMAIFDTTLDGGSTLPPFDDWEEIVIQGVRMFGLIFVYQLPLWILSIGVGVLALGASATLDPAANPQLAEQAFGGVVLVMFLLVGLLSIAISYVLPGALCNAAREHSIAAGFDVDALKATLNREYAIGWLLAGLVYVFLGTIGVIFSFLLVGVPLLFYTLAVGSRLVAIGYRESLPEESHTEAAHTTTTSEDSAEGV